MQNAIVRERTLETQVCSLSNSTPQGSGAYLAAGDAPSAAGMPLYLCLGNIAEMGASNSNNSVQFLTETPAAAGAEAQATQVFLYELEGIEDSDSDISDEEMWLAEQEVDPWTLAQLQNEEVKAAQDPTYLNEL